MKINAIHHRTDTKSETEDLFPPLVLLVIIRNPKRDVMNRAGAETASSSAWNANQVNRFARTGLARGDQTGCDSPLPG